MKRISILLIIRYWVMLFFLAYYSMAGAVGTRVWIELEQQTLAKSLQAIAQKFQLQLAYHSPLAQSKDSLPLRAYVNAEEAFNRVLAPHQLKAVFDARNSVTIIIAQTKAHGTRLKGTSTQRTKPTIEEIIVTAQKRPQNLQTLAMAATVFSDSDIRILHLQPASQLASQVPNMMIKTAIGRSSPIFTLRGVGLNEYAANGSPSVGVYLDQISLASNAMMALQMVDFERIEVLKGPQGDVFGRNTTGGAVSFISRRPELDNSLELETKLGNYRSSSTLAIANVKLQKQLALRLSILDTRQGKGFFYNRQNQSRHGESQRGSYRLGLAWLPSDGQQELYINLHGSKDRSDNALYEHYSTNSPVNPNQSCDANTLKQTRRLGCVNWFSYQDQDNDWYAGDYNLEPHIKDDSKGSVVNYWRKFSSFQLEFLAGYERYKRDVEEEADASPQALAEVYYKSIIEQQSWELRFSDLPEQDENFWMLGFYHASDKNNTNDRYNYRQHPLRLTELLVSYQQQTDSGAVFFRYHRKLNKKLALELGLRYTSEQRQFVGGTTDLDPNNTSLLSGGGVLVYSRESLSAKKTSGRFSLNYNFSEDIYSYISISQGFKSGGFNGFWVESAEALKAYKAEELRAYELGIKTNTLGHSLQLNSAFFYYDYQNLQLFDYDPAIVSFFIDNAPKARVLGFESELWWKPTQGFEFKLGLGLIKTETRRYVSPAGVDYSGKQLANSPSWSVNGLVRKKWALNNNVVLMGQLDFTGQDQFFFSAANDSLTQQGSYFLFNAQVGVSRDNYSVGVWIKNLMDQRFQVEALQSSGGNIMVNPSSPRTWGLSLSHRW